VVSSLRHPTDGYFDLGSYHRPVATSSTPAQLWFDRAMVWSFGFNHEEAVRCFERALEHDPDLALARWGIAYALGPNYNRTWESYDAAGRSEAVRRGRTELAHAATTAVAPVDRDLIAALSLRFGDGDPDDLDRLRDAHLAYTDAMIGLAAVHPDDVDVQALAADALVNVTVWALWDTHTGQPAEGSRVQEARDLLEAALQTEAGRNHPGILHTYLHTMEMSDRPEAALTAADLLRNLVPDSGHLQHMPSHIDVLCGDYAAAVQANKAAVEADRRYVRHAGAVNAYSRYRAHDLHFIVYSAMFDARYGTAMDAARELESQLGPELLGIESPPMADWLEAFAPLRIHVLIRFGRWSELIGEPLPEDTRLYCTTAATVHYGRGLGFAALGRLDDARAARRDFETAYAAIPDSRSLFKVRSRDALAIARAMLDGEIAYRAGAFESAFANLREAVRLDDGLPYDEPWGWMQPTRHALGALLLEQGRVAEAAEVYAADLGYDDSVPRSRRHLSNVWSLHGYHECLRRLGRTGEAAMIAEQLRIAAARADVPIVASCACRLDTVD
jgi:tetratricopeptide (TPR) repeat protein